MSERRRLFGRVVAQAPSGVFLSVVQTQLQSVKDALAEVAKEIEAAEQARHDDLLEASLNPQSEAAAKVDAADVALAGFYAKRSRLQEGLTIAEQAETNRISERDARDLAAKQRAMAAHLGSLVKEIQRVSDCADNLHHTFAKAAKAAQAASALFPHNLRELIELISVDYLRQLLDLQFHKIGRGELVSLHDDRHNPILLGSFEHRVTGEIPSLVEIVSGHCEGIKRAFNDQHSPKPKSTAVAHRAVGEPAEIGSSPGAVSAGNSSSSPEAGAGRPAVPDTSRQAEPATEGDYFPKIRGEIEGNPLRLGSGPGTQIDGALLGVTIGLGGEIIERFAGDVAEAVQRVEPVPAATLAPTPVLAPVAPPHESVTGDTVVDNPALSPRTLNDILAERAGL
jgi:hypothetical protein